MRKTSDELKVIMEKNGCSRIWSWSKFNTYHNSPYEYFLKYIIKKKEDKEDCIYAPVGGMCHDILEKLYTKQIEYKNMDELFEDAWLTAEISELKFDRNDSEKNKNISAKYYSNLKHFFSNHKTISYKTVVEQFVTAKIGDNLFQGYIDMMFKDENGFYNIVDFKTSTVYKNEKAINEAGQLVVYAIALNQMGIPFDKIRIGWNFLKYVSVECTQANGKTTTREIERREIGAKLQSSAKMWLKKLGYNPEDYLDKMVLNNDISILPKDVQEKFKVDDCYIYIDVTQDLLTRWTTNIVNTIDEIISKEKEYKVSLDDKVFWEDYEQVKKQSYYFATLSSYSANLHKPYKDYLKRLDREKNVDLLNNKQKQQINDTETDDLSWLNLI